MLLRRISQGSDFQGPAPLDEKDTSEDVLQLLFGTVDEVESMRFPAALALEQPLLVFYSASPLRTPIWSPFPAQNETLSVDFFVRHSAGSSAAPADAAEYALRVQSFAAGGEFVEFQSLLPRGATIASCTEMTLTLQEPRAKVDRCNRKCACVCTHPFPPQNDLERLQWQASGHHHQQQPRPVHSHGSCSDFFIDELDIRSFAIQFQ